MRVLRTPLAGLFLVGLAVAFAVLVFGQGGARPAAAQPAATPHYDCHDIQGTPPVPPVSVRLQTQFGIHNNVVVGPATKLCLPAAKNQPDIPQVPHLKCYSIDVAATQRAVFLTTQFGTQRVLLGDAKLLCVPVLKTVLSPPGPPAPGPVPQAPNYECFEITGGANDPSGLWTLKTQFGTFPGVDVGPSQLLCLPAIKTILPSGLPEGNLTDTHLECYTAPQPPLDPPRIVELQSEFGVESPVPVLPATMLCTPAIKQLPVGGVADLAPGAGASEAAAATTGGSGWSAGAYAALAGGLAAAALAIAGGGWFARRRFTKN